MKIIIFSAIAWICVLTMARVAAAEELVTFDLARTHAFSGFGVSTWIASPHNPQRDALLRALNARFVRASLPGLIPDNQLPDHASVADIVALIQRNDNAGTNAGMRQFGGELQGLNIRLHIIFWGIPGPWLRSNGTYHYAVTEHLADYANYITGNLLYVKAMGIAPEDVELTNEPNGVWNTQFTPAQYDQLVTLTRAAMNKAGLADWKMEGPGTSNRPADFMQELCRTGHIKLLGNYSFHEYDTRDGHEPAGLRVINPSMDDAPPKTVAITEFSSADPKFSPGPGAPDNSYNPDFGVSVTGEALQLISDGAGEILVWHLEDLPWMTGQTGLLGRDGRPKPVADALVSVFGLIMPGAAAARPLHPLPEIPLVAFKSGATLTICAVNMRSAPADILLHLPAAGRPGETRFFSGVSGPAPRLVPAAGGFLLRLPARTAFAGRFDAA